MDLLAVDSNLERYCGGESRIESEEEPGEHVFTYASAQVAAKKALEKIKFIVEFLEEGKAQ